MTDDLELSLDDVVWPLNGHLGAIVSAYSDKTKHSNSIKEHNLVQLFLYHYKEKREIFITIKKHN